MSWVEYLQWIREFMHICANHRLSITLTSSARPVESTVFYSSPEKITKCMYVCTIYWKYEPRITACILFMTWTTTAAIFHQPLCQQQPKNQLIFLTYKRSDYQGLYDTALSKETLDVSEVNFGLQWVWRSNKAKPHQVKKSTQDWPPLEDRKSVV